jgi:hypothetical protein
MFALFANPQLLLLKRIFANRALNTTLKSTRSTNTMVYPVHYLKSTSGVQGNLVQQ